MGTLVKSQTLQLVVEPSTEPFLIRDKLSRQRKNRFATTPGVSYLFDCPESGTYIESLGVLDLHSLSSLAHIVLTLFGTTERII